MKLRYLALALIAVFVVGCESLAYYTQAVGGHLRVLARARPVDEWLADPGTDAALKQRLETAQRIRAFASKELKLPDNESYASYADLNRSYVVWNVFAAPEFSVEPKKECFPFTGCVSYRGFYSEEQARRHAEKLRSQGFDVHVGGVPAYSTLGWSADPLLSTFIRYPDAQLARLVFHELAHQVVYAKDDTTFNESFAVAVEEEGVRRWLQAEGRTAELAAFQATQVRRREFAERVSQTRERLATVYAMSLSRDELLEHKRGEWARLRAQYPGLPAEPNNAFLASIAVYTELVPAFQRLLAESGSMQTFYKRVKEL
ncbi:MAG TPA: aminopeptidase, partial [Burkholderiales bacterium]|nr:aminopeptidase [Burkholderiales bacterium]